MLKIPAVFFWSGGKDSTLALHHIIKEGIYEVKYLLTTINDEFNRVSIHGVREALLFQQAKLLNIELVLWRLPDMPNMETYERELIAQLDKLKEFGINHAIFGDIFLEDLKFYRENQLNKVGFKAVFPLWKNDTLQVIQEFIDLGYQAMVVCAQDGLQDFCGRVIDESFLNDLPSHIDPCGENGEFHTFVFNGPILRQPINFKIGEKLYKNYPNPSNAKEVIGYWYIDLLPG